MKETVVKSEECDDINRTALAQDSDEPSGYITNRVFHERLNIRLLQTQDLSYHNRPLYRVNLSMCLIN
jgi:hypothetical protein